MFDRLSEDDGVRVIVLTGAGDKAFSAGGDVIGFLQSDLATLSRLPWNVAAAERCTKPAAEASGWRG
jgi:2-oxoglutaroyl-CoA hydrolase